MFSNLFSKSPWVTWGSPLRIRRDSGRVSIGCSSFVCSPYIVPKRSTQISWFMCQYRFLDSCESPVLITRASSYWHLSCQNGSFVHSYLSETRANPMWFLITNILFNKHWEACKYIKTFCRLNPKKHIAMRKAPKERVIQEETLSGHFDRDNACTFDWPCSVKHLFHY